LTYINTSGIIVLERGTIHEDERRAPRRNMRLMGILQEMYDQWAGVPHKVNKLPAVDFRHFYEKYSPPTVVKAKRLLGIRSSRSDGIWFWSKPKKTPEEALSDRYQKDMSALDEARQEINRINSKVCKTLSDIMHGIRFCDLNTHVLSEMDLRGYGKIATYRAKAALGIATKRVNGEWLWLWYDDQVVQWLEKKLEDGPVPVHDILEAGEREHHWHPEVVKMAREAIGTIRFSMQGEKLYWFNSADPIEKEPVDTRTPTSVIQRKGYAIKNYMPAAVREREEAQYNESEEHIISVDFTPEAEEAEEPEDLSDGMDIETFDGAVHKVTKKAVSAGPGLPNILMYEEAEPEHEQ
jgi:hypothetical protein